ncbi:formate dehydrogenase subunit alpha [Utexia brackfieldae]|uniref:formate dehydrogenase subunit alpha n=1 Tax=Utexia brackfieldae TaxID=3074108 RepID=UPI00370D2B7F
MKKVLTVCPYCASGCKIDLLVENNKIISAQGANGITNQGELCLKGYYGWDFLNDTKILTPRLTQPLIRRQKGGQFESATWDEAIDYVSERLTQIKQQHGPDAIMLTGSSRGTGNETNYVMQKFARAVVGTNNIDCCARVCHGPSVAALQVTLGNGAMSNSINDLEETKCILIFGYNAADSHPIVARRILKAKEKGAKIIVCDPRFIETARIADLWLPLKNGSNMALVNAFLNVLINEHLYNKDYVKQFTEGFDELKAVIEKYTPEYVEEITGLSAKLIRDAAHMYAKAPSATILWGMGVTQWGQSTDVIKGLSSMALVTGNLGRPAVGVGPVRGQNNVQGACDMGATPKDYPGYQKVADPAVRNKFAQAWGVPLLPETPGCTITEVPHRILEGKIKAYYVMGEDPLQTDPDLSAMREALEKVDFLVVQDIFMTKTAAEADVILPATSWGEHEGIYTSADRGFQHFEKAIEPTGNVKVDWDIISLISSKMGYPMAYQNTQAIWDEMRMLCDLYKGATYQKMAKFGYVQWPCPTEDHAGTPYLYKGNKFDRPNGKGLLACAEWVPPKEQIDEDFPMVLCTVREVGHYSCRSMTGNCRPLQTLADEPGYVQINPADATRLGIVDQALVFVESRRGKVITRADVTPRANKGAVYMTYQWWIGACNELTLDHLDPVSRTPEYKHSAVKVSAIDDQTWAEEEIAQRYAELKQYLQQTADVA